MREVIAEINTWNGAIFSMWIALQANEYSFFASVRDGSSSTIGNED